MLSVSVEPLWIYTSFSPHLIYPWVWRSTKKIIVASRRVWNEICILILCSVHAVIGNYPRAWYITGCQDCRHVVYCPCSRRMEVNSVVAWIVNDQSRWTRLVLGSRGEALWRSQAQCELATAMPIVIKRKSRSSSPSSPVLPLLRASSKNLIQITRSLFPALRRSLLLRLLLRSRWLFSILPRILMLTRIIRNILLLLPSCRLDLPLLLANKCCPPFIIVIFLIFNIRTTTSGSSSPRLTRHSTRSSPFNRRSLFLRRLHNPLIILAEQLFPQMIIRAQLRPVPASIGRFFGERGADTKPVQGKY